MTSKNGILVLCLGSMSLCPNENLPSEDLKNRVLQINPADFCEMEGRTAKEASYLTSGIDLATLPDWDGLNGTHLVEDRAGYRRYFARRSILCDQGRILVENKLRHAPKPSRLFIACDLTDPFASGILWDIARIARAVLMPSEVIGLFGLPVEDEEQQAEDRGELYATLKELNNFVLREGTQHSSSCVVMDRVFFTNRHCLAEPKSAKHLLHFLTFLMNEEFLSQWVRSLEEKQLTLQQFLTPSQVPGGLETFVVEKRPCAYSAVFSTSIDSSPAAEAFLLKLGRDVLQELLGQAEAGLSPEEILDAVGISEKGLSLWIADQVDDVAKIMQEEKPLTTDEFTDLIHSSLSRVTWRANERSYRLFARKDLPGRLGKQIDRLLDQHSLKSGLETINELDKYLQGLAREFSGRLYAAFGGVEPLSEFLEDYARQKSSADALIKDQVAGKFLPPLAHGIKREDLKTISSSELAERQRSYLEAQITFNAYSQCLMIIQCALEDLRSFTKEAMKVREFVLSMCESQIESRLKQATDSITTTDEIYWEWVSQLPASLHPRALADMIRTGGLLTEAKSVIRLKELERGYPHTVLEALLTFLKKRLELEGQDPDQWIVGSKLLPKAIAATRSQQTSMVQDLANTSQPLQIENLICSPLDPELTLNAPTTGRESCTVRPTAIWGFYRFVHGFPLTCLKDISSWHFDYVAAIEEQKPVHVLKSAVYAQNPYLDPDEPLPLPAEPLFWACLAFGILDQDERGAVAYTGKRECLWGFFWDRAGEKPIWMEKEAFLKALQEHFPLQQELSSLLLNHLVESLLDRGLSYDELAMEIAAAVENLRGALSTAAPQVRSLLEEVRPDVENTLSIFVSSGSSNANS